MFRLVTESHTAGVVASGVQPLFASCKPEESSALETFVEQSSFSNLKATAIHMFDMSYILRQQ
jgi:hypothetical protein